MTLRGNAGVAIAIGVLFYGISLLYKKWRSMRDAVPTEWVAVGKVTDLLMVPVKSFAPVRVQKMHCTVLGPVGLGNKVFRDRTFVVRRTSDGLWVSACQRINMVKIQPEVRDTRLILNAPGMPEIQVDVTEVESTGVQARTNVKDAWIDVLDCGEEVARWLSRFLLDEDEGLRLGYYPYARPTRPMSQQERNRIWPDMTDEHGGLFGDESSYMMINEESVRDLNGRLKDLQVTPLWFRPSIVCDGLPAFQEDRVKFFRIGNHTVFKNLKPCIRCNFTTIDPDTAQRNPSVEPLKTLRGYRLLPGCGQSPGMGVHLGLISEQDVISVGDTVYIPK